MTESVVDGLEPIQIEPEERDCLLALPSFAERQTEPVAKAGAIGEPGQRIGMGHVVQPPFGELALLGLAPHDRQRQRHGKQDQQGQPRRKGNELLAIVSCLVGLVEVNLDHALNAAFRHDGQEDFAIELRFVRGFLIRLLFLLEHDDRLLGGENVMKSGMLVRGKAGIVDRVILMAAVRGINALSATIEQLIAENPSKPANRLEYLLIFCRYSSGRHHIFEIFDIVDEVGRPIQGGAAKFLTNEMVCGLPCQGDGSADDDQACQGPEKQQDGIPSKGPNTALQ